LRLSRLLPPEIFSRGTFAGVLTIILRYIAKKWKHIVKHYTDVMTIFAVQIIL
jgi:hypothetical protein